jgi:hypothetical protein
MCLLTRIGKSDGYVARRAEGYQALRISLRGTLTQAVGAYATELDGRIVVGLMPAMTRWILTVRRRVSWRHIPTPISTSPRATVPVTHDFDRIGSQGRP